MTPLEHSEQSKHGIFNPDPETIRQRRLEREERDARQATEERHQLQANLAHTFIAIGAGLLLAGLWFLLVSPSQGEVQGTAIANLHRLTLGETAAVVGSIFIVGGTLLKFR